MKDDSMIPGIIIAGTNSGCGKTTVSMGIMAALVEQGMTVQPFKVGPDYIDPMFHTLITGRHSRNLDSWMLSEETVGALYSKNLAGCDIAVIEGVMGMFDGFGGTSITGSTAHVAKLLGAPVILVVNAGAMSLSAAALVKGFVEFDREVQVAGVIFNKVSGEGHYKLLKQAVETHVGIPAFGWLKENRAISLESRHLGLVTGMEVADLKERAAILSKAVQETIDLKHLIKVCSQFDRNRPMPPVQSAVDTKPLSPKVRIAVAQDKAFCFYYKDNLDLLEGLGATLVSFSPTADARLPEDIDGLYLGGGYPEVWAQALEGNVSMRNSIKQALEEGLPGYAECGGLMYLTRSIETLEGKIHDMVGFLPGTSRMTAALKRFGYVEVMLAEDTLLGDKGDSTKAHEFHYSETELDADASSGKVSKSYKVMKKRDGMPERTWECGFRRNNLLAGYPHLHFWSNPDFAANFIRSCEKHRQQKSEV